MKNFYWKGSLFMDQCVLYKMECCGFKFVHEEEMESSSRLKDVINIWRVKVKLSSCVWKTHQKDVTFLLVCLGQLQ